MNIGHFMFDIARKLMELGGKLYDMFTYQIDISFVSKMLSFFNASIEIPKTISLSYIIGGMSGVILIGLIIYNIFKL